jgi:hypothetical protein
MCVRNSASVSTTIQLEFGTFATAWYFFLWFFISLFTSTRKSNYVCLVFDGHRWTTQRYKETTTSVDGLYLDIFVLYLQNS